MVAFLVKTRLAFMMFLWSILELLWCVFKVLYSFIAIFLAWTSSVENLAELNKFIGKSFHDTITRAKAERVNPEGKDQ